MLPAETELDYTVNRDFQYQFTVLFEKGIQADNHCANLAQREQTMVWKFNSLFSHRKQRKNPECPVSFSVSISVFVEWENSSAVCLRWYENPRGEWRTVEIPERVCRLIFPRSNTSSILLGTIFDRSQNHLWQPCCK